MELDNGLENKRRKVMTTTQYKGSGLILSDFEIGERVTYIPLHAVGDAHHPDIEYGVVSSIGGRFVFVRFGTHETAEACAPNDLVKTIPSLPKSPPQLGDNIHF